MNKILIDIRDLKNILEKHRGYIGKSRFSGIDSLMASIGFLFTVWGFDFKDYVVLQVVAILAAVAYSIWSICNLVRLHKTKFDKDVLLQLIEEKNMIEESPHSIILIKDTFNKNSNKYLVYYDSRWDCKLFPNYSTADSEDENIARIESRISSELKTNAKECVFLFEKIHSKYSESAKKEKVYDHRFYQATLKSFPRQLHESEFAIDGKQYYWMSIAEMEADPVIMKKNSDIVDLVKKYG